jgi:hypothetical protein
MGPRVHDLELKNIIDLILQIRAAACSFEAANPRHEHEWKVWEHAALPEDKILIPGLVTQSSVVVEHPELVAQRITRFAGVVGRERVIAGSDCGFAIFAVSPPSRTVARSRVTSPGRSLPRCRRARGWPANTCGSVVSVMAHPRAGAACRRWRARRPIRSGG